ncbi:hypothetical protein ACFSYG_19265 [Leeuwenhoekiella polynyae]|uniref:YhhN-like protein n=1 Tax=Leeuwenhoekiella polynyae TaxID=1550906 RepID=A0A4Q0PER2_9FLAO|nr:hypothetical protein [Leeuwenhoekiella polynyae]RXG25313.1 hypothetical protein DSM02_1283 [Leeuwenhoekiella polynyae]
MKGIQNKDLERFQMLFAIGLGLVIVNCLAVLFFPTFISRMLRFVGSTLLIGFFVFSFPKQSKVLMLALIAFWLRDIAAIFYEDSLISLGFFICGGIAYFSLFFRQLKNLLRFKLMTPSFAITGFVVLACFGMLYSLESVLAIQDHERSLIYYYYFLGISIVFSLLLAIYYYYRLGSLRALLFSFAVFSFAISDIAAYLGIYLENYLFFFDYSDILFCWFVSAHEFCDSAGWGSI